MNSRERVLTTIEHRTPDRLPLDYTADAEVTAALCRRLGVSGEEALLETLDIDIRKVKAVYFDGDHRTKLPTGETVDVFGIRRSAPDPKTGLHGGYAVHHPLAEAKTRADVEAYPWPDPDAVDYDKWADLCRAAGDHARFGGPPARVFFDAVDMVGFDQYLTWLYEEPELARLVMDKIADYAITVLRRFVARAPGEIDVLMTGSDFGTQRSLIIKPAMWRDFVRPPFERVYRCAKELGLKVYLHSDGAIRAVIPDLLDIGMDVLNPIQVGAVGMEPASLKREFGDRLTFHGAIDVQKTLPFGTPEDVRDEVLARFNDLGVGGGYILSCSHSLLRDVPLDNILAMYDTARECRYDRVQVAVG